MQFSVELLRTDSVTLVRIYHQEVNDNPLELTHKACFPPTNIRLDTRFFIARFNMKPILNLNLTFTKLEVQSSKLYNQTKRVQLCTIH